MQVIIILLLMYAQSNGGFGFRNFTHTDPLLRPTYKTISIQSTSSNLQFFPRLVYASDSDEVLPLTTGDTAATPRYRKPNLGIYLAEGGASFIGGNVVGIGVPILLAIAFPLGEYNPATHYTPSFAYFLLYPIIYSFPSAFAIDITGKIFKCPGSFWGAVGGGFLGLALGMVGYEYDLVPDYAAFTSFFVLPPVLSVVGYNLFRKGDQRQSDVFSEESYLMAQFYSSETNPMFQRPNLQIKVKVIEVKF